jgi:tyrosinase
VSLNQAFQEDRFVGPDGGVIDPGFGGAVSGRAHLGQLMGKLEVVPHGMVHMRVGGVSPVGWMSRFETAGRDPIFWLHHANLDRLWESWLALPGGRANPPDNAWASQEFALGGGPWVTRLTVAEMLDTSTAPLNYRYDQLQAEPTPAAAGVERVPREEAALGEGAPPEMVGASIAPVPLGHRESSAEIEIQTPAGPLASAWEEARPRRVYLKLESVVGSRLAAGSYDVYLDLPNETVAASDRAEKKVGAVPLFGVVEASGSDDEHPGSGLSFTLDVTEAATDLLRSSGGGLDRLRVTFAPTGEKAGEDAGSDVQVGGVKLFFA